MKRKATISESDPSAPVRTGFLYDNEGRLMVWTDGCCSKNGTPSERAGIGVRFNLNHPRNISEPLTGRPKNNDAQIQAVTRAMKEALDAGEKRIRIITDAQFVIKSVMKDMPKWKSNGWRRTNGKPLENEESFKKLDEARKSLMEVHWELVKSHTSNEGNQEAH